MTATMKRKEVQKSSEFHPVQLGDFVQQLLVTDTRVYEVIKVTDKSVTLRKTMKGSVLSNENMIILTEAKRDLAGEIKILRLRKDGTFRFGNYARASNLTKARTVDGVPVSKVDMSF